MFSGQHSLGRKLTLYVLEKNGNCTVLGEMLYIHLWGLTWPTLFWFFVSLLVFSFCYICYLLWAIDIYNYYFWTIYFNPLCFYFMYFGTLNVWLFWWIYPFNVMKCPSLLWVVIFEWKYVQIQCLCTYLDTIWLPVLKL